MSTVNVNDIKIDPSKFELVNEADKLHDKKFEDKPIGYFKDAWIRFRKSKASVVAAAIIVFIVLFALIAPMCIRSHDQAFMVPTYAKNSPRIVALKNRGIALNDHSILHISYNNIEQAEEITMKIVKEYPDVTAIIYPDDITALVAIHKLRELGYKVPKNISVAGFDGALFTSYLTHPLTTMRQDTNEIGEALAKTLIDVIKNPSEQPKVVELNATLIKGRTVAKI